MDITLIRFESHYRYILPRIYDNNKKQQFVSACESILMNKDFDISFDYNTPGAKMALDIYQQIEQIHNERFIYGRSGDALLEKL